MKILEKNKIFGEKLKFLRKKRKILAENENFGEKWKFWPNMKNFGEK